MLNSQSELKFCTQNAWLIMTDGSPTKLQNIVLQRTILVTFRDQELSNVSGRCRKLGYLIGPQMRGQACLKQLPLEKGLEISGWLLMLVILTLTFPICSLNLILLSLSDDGSNFLGSLFKVVGPSFPSLYLVCKWSIVLQFQLQSYTSHTSVTCCQLTGC